MNILVFDIETIPDVSTGRRLYHLDGLSDKHVAKAMYSLRSQETEGRTEFLRHHLHRVVAISAVLRTADRLTVWSLGEVDSSEKELIQRFFDGIERYNPMLVTWNGRGFDLPVLHYRALLHNITAARYWETGDNDSSFRWNNYINRFHERHTDLMDVLSGYESRACAPLDSIAQLLGFPGKMDASGAEVWDRYLDGDIQGIRDYCETDVLNTYLVFLRYELMRGRLDEQEHTTECERLREMLRNEKKPHLDKFMEGWVLASQKGT
jgi:hypothetical protein